MIHRLASALDEPLDVVGVVLAFAAIGGGLASAIVLLLGGTGSAIADAAARGAAVGFILGVVAGMIAALYFALG
jgi:hypothetical protein